MILKSNLSPYIGSSTSHPLVAPAPSQYLSQLVISTSCKIQLPEAKGDFDVAKIVKNCFLKSSLCLQAIGTVQFQFFELPFILSGQVKELFKGVSVLVGWIG